MGIRVDGAKTIRLIAVFVGAIVVAMGGAMIYSIASQMRRQPNLAAQASQPRTEDGELSNGVATTTGPRLAERPPSAEIAKRSSEQPTGAHMRPPEMTILRVDGQENRPRMPEVQAPSYAAASTSPLPTPTSRANAAAWSSPPAVSAKRPLNSQPPTTQLLNAAQIAPSPSPDDEPPSKPASAATAARPHTVTLWSGMPLTVKLIDPLSTDHVKPGQYFHATLAAPIVRDGFVIAEPGSGATGKVIASKHAGMFGRAPDLRLILVELRTTDNQIVHVQTTSWDDRGRGHNLVSGTVRSAFGAVSGAVTGAARGSGLVAQDRASTDSRNVFLPTNSLLEFRLAAPVSLTEHTR